MAYFSCFIKRFLIHIRINTHIHPCNFYLILILSIDISLKSIQQSILIAMSRKLNELLQAYLLVEKFNKSIHIAQNSDIILIINSGSKDAQKSFFLNFVPAKVIKQIFCMNTHIHPCNFYVILILSIDISLKSIQQSILIVISRKLNELLQVIF